MIREHIICVFFKHDFEAYSRKDVTFFKISNTIIMSRAMRSAF
jgi:hypothetical protein